ncbi:MAG: MBL fold metallo-hydrolase [Rhodobacteraceae bacterium]|nr:MBL fold metallo-hydrolase [Paracoccaceae bacterium]
MSDRPEPGQCVELASMVRRILAPNPSPMTFWGTNTYLVGDATLAVIDPGPDDTRHLAAILSAIGGAAVSHILITHAHRDHSPGAAALSAETGAPIYGFGPPDAGRTPVMQDLAARGLAGGGEGVDMGFAPDVTLADGAQISSPDWRMTTLHTPGHFAGHLSFALDDLIFTGDHVMGWASTLISPPDGDVAAFLSSCDVLAARKARRFFPGHGAPVDDPAPRLDWLVAHRKDREAQILDALHDGPADAATLAAKLYTDTPASLMPAAARNVLAHLIDLTERRIVSPDPDLRAEAVFTRA